MSKVLLEITILFIYATKKKDPRNFGYSCQGRHDYKFIFWHSDSLIFWNFKLIEIHNFASFQYFLFNLVGRHTVV